MFDRGARFMGESKKEKKAVASFFCKHLQAFSFAGRLWFFIFG